MLSEGKGVSRTVAVGLGMLCLGVLVGLAVVIWNENSVISNYVSLVDSKDKAMSDLWGQLTDLQVRVSSLSQQLANLSGQIAVKDAQIANESALSADLQSRVTVLEAPQIIGVDLKAEDRRPPEWAEPQLHVDGYVFNAGLEWAYHVRLHVVAYQAGGALAVDYYMQRGNLWGRWWIDVNEDIPYVGEALSNWTLTPEWTATP
jgi:hypothetical protein